MREELKFLFQDLLKYFSKSYVLQIDQKDAGGKIEFLACYK